MKNENSHMSRDEILSVVEQGDAGSAHVVRCARCRKEIEELREIVTTLSRVWHPPALTLPSVHVILTEAKRKEASNRKLLSATFGWSALLVVACVSASISGTLVSQIGQRVASLHSGIGNMWTLSLMMILFGIVVSPVVVLLGGPRLLERSYAR